VELSCIDFHPNWVKIYLRPWDNIAFVVQMFRELRITQRYCAGIFCTECHQNRSRNAQIAGGNSLTLFSTNIAELIFTKLTLARQIFVKNYNTEFHKYSIKALVADTK
jgi:hypothetical protein